MSRSINFVRDRQRTLSKLEIQDRKFLRIAGAGLAIVVLLTLLVITARFYLIYQYKAITEDQAQLRSQIVAREEIERSFTIFSHKLKILTDLFGKRKEKQETLAYFSNLFGPDVIIQQLSYDASDEMLSFTLQAKNIFVLDTVIVIMNSPELEARYPDLQKNGLNRGGSGNYSMNIMIALGDKPLPGTESKDATLEDDTLETVSP